MAFENIDKICRTCLSEDTTMKSVFSIDETNGDTMRIDEMLMSCAAIQVIEDDGLPMQVCLQCTHYILKAFSFKQLCEKSDSTLRQILGHPSPTYLDLKPYPQNMNLEINEIKDCENLEPKIESVDIELPRICKMEEETFSFGSTSRGGPTLVYKSYEYLKHRMTPDNVIHWRCRKHQAAKCKSIIHTRGSRIVQHPIDHTHDIVPFQPLATKAIAEMKQMMTHPGVTPKQAMAEVTQNLSNGIKTCLPKKTTLIRTLQRCRIAENSTPVPRDITFEIPEMYAPYVLFDSGREDNNRIIILGKNDLLRFLEQRTCWIADGTFKVVPELFFQLYSIHVQEDSTSWPCVLALLPGKSQDIYTRLFNALKNLIPEAAPTRILTDFEMTAMNSFHAVFPTAQISGCFFHLSQTILRKVGALGLKDMYQDNTYNIATSIKMLCALSLLPLEEVEDAFLEVSETFPDDQQNIEELISYFEVTFIRGRQLCGERRREATFPMDMWNQRDAAAAGIARTTNCVEGWHNGLQSLFQCAHPTMWTFLSGLVKETELSHAHYLHYISGQRIPMKNRYKSLKLRLQNMIENYETQNRLTFLRTVSYLF